MNTPEMLVVLIDEESRAICFRHHSKEWTVEPIDGGAWTTLDAPGESLRILFDKLNKRINLSEKLAGFIIHVVYAQGVLKHLATLPETLGRLACARWQILRLEPILQRARSVSGLKPGESLMDEKSLNTYFLPALEILVKAEEDTLVQERALVRQAQEKIRAAQQEEKREHEQTVDSLKAEKKRLQIEVDLLRGQRANSEQVVAFMPAVYRNFFGTISPNDLALLTGTLKIPEIPSPFREPDANTVATLQWRLRHLPEDQAGQIRSFCLQLQHKLEVRAEMRDWLGVDEP